MLDIIINELKKPFFNKFFRWFLAFILMINLILCVSLLTVQKKGVLRFYSINQTPEGYTTRMDSICSEAESNKRRLLRFNATENDYAYRYQDEVIARYTHLKNTVEILPDYDMVGWSEYFQYSYSNIFAVIGSIIFVCSIIVYDRTIGMWSITRTTRRGRGLIYISKSLAVFGLSFVFALLCYLTVLGAVWYVHGLATPFASLQNLTIFTLSAFDGSILQFFIFTLLQKSLVIAVYASVTAAVAAFFGQYFAPILCGVGIYAVGFVFYSLPLHNSWKYLNFYASLNPHSFFSRYQSINVFGKPISTLGVCAVVTVLLLCAAFVISFIGLSEPIKNSSSKLAVLKAIRLPSFKLKRRAKNHTLMGHEIYKIFSPGIVLVLLLCAAFHAYSDIELFRYDESNQRKLLYEYCELLSKMDRDEQTVYVASELERLKAITDREQEMTDLYFGGKISSSEFIEYNKSFADASARLEPLGTISSRLSYLARAYEEKNIRGQLVFDSHLEKLLSGTSPIGIYVCIILIACTAATIDYQKKDTEKCFWSILSTTKNGRRKTLQLKMRVICASISLLVLLFSVIDIISYLTSTNSPSLMIPLVSFPSFSSTDSGIPIIVWYIIELIFKLLFSCGLGIFSFCMVVFIKNTFYSYVILLIITLLPKLLSQMGIKFLSYIDPIMLLSPPQLYHLSAQLPHFDYLFELVYLAIILGAVVAIGKSCYRHCENNE